MGFFPGTRSSYLVVFFSVVFSLGIWTTLNYQPWLAPNEICPGVQVKGTRVGGLPQKAAYQRLRKQFDPLLNQPISLSVGKQLYQVIPQKLGYHWGYQQALNQAYHVGRVGSIGKRIWEQMIAYWSGRKINLTLQLDTKIYDAWVQKLAEQVEQRPVPAEVTLGNQGKMIVKPEKYGQELNFSAFKRELEEVLLEHQARRVAIPIKKLKPEVTQSDLVKFQIEKLIGSYSTNFEVSNVNRSKNIRVAAQALKQVLVKPDEVFSYNKVIEQKTRPIDWRKAPVIIEGELVEGLGGGICQVSTTLYNAALLANLQIVERSHHSLPVGYVPVGRDATVAGNYLDLKLGHKQHQAFLVTASVEQNRVIVNIFGSDNGSLSVEIKQSPVQEIQPPTKVIKDAKLPRGMISTKEGKKGYRITTWRIINNNGKFQEELISKDVYRPLPTEIYQGTGD